MIDFNDVINFNNVILSFKQCLKGKYKKRNALLMFKYLENEIWDLYNDLRNKKYKHCEYNFFTNYDSKKRKIASAHLRDKIVHRMLYNTLNDEFDKNFIFDSYACRINKGTSRAIKRCQKFLRNKNLVYFLKSDIRKYFDNIDHKILKQFLLEKIKDNDIMNLLNIIIDSYYIVENKGVPIGNLTSQMFANIYLNKVDQFIKHKLKVRYYIRYMDDFIILSDDKDYLKKLLEEIREFLQNNLQLEISNKHTILAKIDNGVIFLGKRIFWNKVFILDKTKKILRNRIYWLKRWGILEINSENDSCINVLYSYFNYIKYYNYRKFNFFTRTKIAKYFNCKLKKMRK